MYTVLVDSPISNDGLSQNVFWSKAKKTKANGARARAYTTTTLCYQMSRLSAFASDIRACTTHEQVALRSFHHPLLVCCVGERVEESECVEEQSKEGNGAGKKGERMSQCSACMQCIIIGSATRGMLGTRERVCVGKREGKREVNIELEDLLVCIWLNCMTTDIYRLMEGTISIVYSIIYLIRAPIDGPLSMPVHRVLSLSIFKADRSQAK